MKFVPVNYRVGANCIRTEAIGAEIGSGGIVIQSAEIIGTKGIFRRHKSRMDRNLDMLY